MAQRGEEIETEEKRLSIKFIQHLAQKSKDECKDCTNLNPSRNWDFIKAVDFKKDRKKKIEVVKSSFKKLEDPDSRNTSNNRSSRKNGKINATDGTNAHNLLKKYLKKKFGIEPVEKIELEPHQEEQAEKFVEAIEKRFKFKFIASELNIQGYASQQKTKPIYWSGKIDAIGVMEDGKIIVIDWKLTSNVVKDFWEAAAEFSPKLHQSMIYRELIIAAGMHDEKDKPVVGILLVPMLFETITVNAPRLCLCFEKLREAGFFEKISKYTWTAQKPGRGDEHDTDKVKAEDSGDILIQGQKQAEGMTEDQLRDSTKNLLSLLRAYWKSLCDKDRQGLFKILKSWTTSMDSKDSRPKTPSIIKEESTVKKGKEGEYRGTGARPKVRQKSFNEKDKQGKKEKGTLNSKRESTSNDKPKTAPIIKEESKVEAGARGAGCSCHGRKKCPHSRGAGLFLFCFIFFLIVSLYCAVLSKGRC